MWAERDFWKRRYISKQERNNNGSQYITLGREKLTTSHIPYSTFWGISCLTGLDMIFMKRHTSLKYKSKILEYEKTKRVWLVMGNMSWTSMTVTFGSDTICNSPSLLLSRYCLLWPVTYCYQPHDFKTHILGIGFHTLIRNTSFPLQPIWDLTILFYNWRT